MTTASARLLVGRKIVGFELNTWRDENGVHHNPIITLDNGAQVGFTVTETEHGDEYGVSPDYFPHGLKPRSP